jgi:DNA-binding NarL/FixJ family response regulator
VIEDDGAGFDQRAVGGEGVGLLGMRERLSFVDGRLEIESRPAPARRSSPRCRSGERPGPHRRRPRGRPQRPAALLEAEEGLEPVGEAGNARDAVFQARALNPDVILLDLVMPEKTGLEALPQLKHENPDAQVLILSMQDEPRYVREAFAAGASGYVLKEAADNEVVAAIREVAGGGRYVNPELGARLMSADAEAAKLAEADPLSDREREVLRLLALGHANQ